MVVIAIISIMTSISIVAFANSKRTTALETASREVMAVLREAQNYALSGKNIDSTCASYNVLAVNSTGSYFLKNNCALNYNFVLKNGVTFSSGGVISFLSPHGKLNGGGNKFVITNGTNSYAICVNNAGLITRKSGSVCP